MAYDEETVKRVQKLLSGHPDVVTNYRKGHDIYERTVSGDASTEDLRVAVVSYRSLYDDLVRDGEDREDAAPR